MSDDDARPAGGGWLLPAVLGVLLVAVIAVSVVLWGERSDEPSVATDSSGPMQAARSLAEDAAIAFFTLDHRAAAQNIAAARTLMTDEFGAEYEREAASLRREVVKRKLSLVPSLVEDGTAIETFGPEAAQLLVSVDLTTTAPGGKSGDARYRTRVALVRDGDEWLVSGLDQVG